MSTVYIIATMSIVTIIIRFIPFFVFKKKTPQYISYLGDVLPPAIIGMLVIYCLKDINFKVAYFGIPELLSVAVVIALHTWKRNSLISILFGTVFYMLLKQFVF